jgi:hypothetical protein
MTEAQRNKLLFKAFLDLDAYMHEYRKALLWLTHGNHKATPHPTVQVTRQLVKELGDKITALVADIESQLHER